MKCAQKEHYIYRKRHDETSSECKYKVTNTPHTQGIYINYKTRIASPIRVMKKKEKNSRLKIQISPIVQ